MNEKMITTVHGLGWVYGIECLLHARHRIMFSLLRLTFCSIHASRDVLHTQQSIIFTDGM